MLTQSFGWSYGFISSDYNYRTAQKAYDAALIKFENTETFDPKHLKLWCRQSFEVTL